MDDHQLARLATEISQDGYHQDASSPSQDGATAAKRKAEDMGSSAQPQQRSKRNRYISIACNECKRRKIKCNGQTPCQRCGNLNLECIYSPNCCSAFKDAPEYKEMTAQIGSLQEQVNALFHELNDVCAQLGRGAVNQQMQPAPSSQQQQPSLTSPARAASQNSSHTPIDPSLQSHAFPTPRELYSGSQASPRGSFVGLSPSGTRARSQSQNNPPTFRGPTSSAFSLGVAKSSLQTMGITSPHDEAQEGSGGSQAATREASPDHSQVGRNSNQFRGEVLHADKDPIWSVSLEEALRLCQIYEDEMGLMYPVLDIENIIAYARKLFRFMEATYRSGLFQKGAPGSDSIDDQDTNILKLVLAIAMTVEGSGKSELGRRMFDYVQPAIDNLLLGSVGIKGVQLLTMAAMYEFHCDNEGTSWRLIGLTARLCIELGLHRRETYEAMQDESERSEAILVFWAIYVLDRRWSFGTGMPFALQDGDIDPSIPKPEGRSPYLDAMIQYSAIGSKVWRSVAAAQSPSNGVNLINVEDMGYLDYQVMQWHRNIPAHLRFEHPSQTGQMSTPSGPAPSRAGHRLRILLYLRANQMRILIYRPVLLSATSIMQHRDQADTVVNVAQDTIRVLTHINQTSDLYRTQQVLFNAFLTSALAVLFLSVSHTPAIFAQSVREEFYMALELVRGFSSGSWVSKRLWKTIRSLKEVAPKLGLPARDAGAHPSQNRSIKADLDPSRSAAVAMAGLAGHNVDEMALYANGSQSVGPGGSSSTSPNGMVDDLTTLFEAAGEFSSLGNGNNTGSSMYGSHNMANGEQHLMPNGDDGLANILRDLF